MVVVKIMQGLGNQMFQYAAGRALSLHLKQELKINIDNYSETSLRQYELAKFFEMDPAIVSKQEMSQFDLVHPVRKVWNKIFKNKKIRSLPYEERPFIRAIYAFVYLFRPPHLQRVYEEKQFHYDECFFDAKQPVFLKGYWMSHKYFSRFNETIRKDFTVRRGLVAHLDDVVKEIQSTNSIALHIRCGDKLQQQYIDLMGILTPEYYHAGINLIKEKKGSIGKIYAFTDTLDAAMSYLPASVEVEWISAKTKNAIEDFYLMTQCRNIIISNSTFSWWAAYLNTQQDKIVVAPKKWYSNAPYDSKDLYCDDWVKI